MQMIAGSNKWWGDLTARQRAPLVVREIVKMTLPVASLTDIHRRPTEEIKGSKWVWSIVACANFMSMTAHRKGGPLIMSRFRR
jgi:hypothetical protein